MSNKREAAKMMAQHHSEAVSAAASKAPVKQHQGGLCKPCHDMNQKMMMAQYTVNSCGKCMGDFLTGGGSPSSVPYFQVMCKKCGAKEKKCYGCGAPFADNTGDKDDSKAAAASAGDFEERMKACIKVMTELSSFSSLHPTYVTLFQELWQKYDPKKTGYIARNDLSKFAKDMVDAGWKDWADNAPVTHLEERVSLEKFAVWAESE